MGVVWEAHDLVLDRDVAVKVVVASGHAAPMRTEAVSAARLVHPHIAGVYDYGEFEGPHGLRTPFVVMELLGWHAAVGRADPDVTGPRVPDLR